MKLLLLFILASCANQAIKPEVTPSPTPAPVETPVPRQDAFTPRSSLEYIKEASRIASCVIRNKDFLKEVGSFPKYTFTDKTPADVENVLRNFKPVVISTYKYWSSKVIATTYAKDRTTLYFNTNANPRKMAYMINTALHEGLHLNGFSHGDNSSKGKQDSVNYRVGDIAEKYTEKCE